MTVAHAASADGAPVDDDVVPGPHRRQPRRPRRLVHLLAPVLVGAASISLATIAVANQVATTQLDDEQALLQLDELQQSRNRAITSGLERLRTSVSLLASDRSLVDAMVDLRAGVAALDAAAAAGIRLLDPEEEAELDLVLAEIAEDEQVRRALTAADHRAPTLDELVTVDPTARYLQHRYLRVPRPVDTTGTDEASLDDPGTEYAQALERHAAALARLDEGFADVWLVDIDRDRVLYSAAGGPELGTDATTGLVGGTVVGQLLAVELRRTTVGEVALTDVGPYLDGPSMFLAELVRDAGEVVGAVVIRIPVEALDSLMTAEGRFAEVGLGETGQTYVVGRDQRLRSSARSHVEDPDGHVAALRDRGRAELADLVEATGSTVLVTPAETRPVRAALDGRSFNGRASDLDGRESLTVATPLGVAGLDWVVVAEITRAEALTESSQQLRRQLLLAALLLPAVAAAGVLLSWYLVRPVRPLVAAIERVAAGAEESGLRDRSRDEFGHLARELDRMAELLASERRRLAEEEATIDRLLDASFPPVAARAVRVGRPSDAASTVTATVLAVAIDAGNERDRSVTADGLDLDQLVSRHDEITAGIDELVAAHGGVRVHAAGDRLLYLIGLGTGTGTCDDHDDDHGAATAERLGAEMLANHADIHIARATGSVSWGLVGGARPALAVWGDPVRDALTLLATAAPRSRLGAPTPDAASAGPGPD